MTTTAIPAPTTYSDRDYDSLVQRLYDLADSVLDGTRDPAEANELNIALQACAYVGDVLNYYQDMNAREARWAWMQLRRSAIALGKLINYTLDPATAASGQVRLTVTNAAALTGVVRPASTPVVVRTNEASPIRGEVQDAIAIDVGGGVTYVDVDWEHSLTQPTYIQASTGKAEQKVYIPYAPFLENSEVVSTTTQPTWTRVDNFLRSEPSDCHYRLQVDHLDHALITFGSGKRGAIPVGDIRVGSKIGGGTAGNLAAGALIRCDASFVDEAGHPAYIEVTQAADTAGGNPREEVESAKVNGPESLRAPATTIAREDYEINAKRVPSIGRALMLTREQLATIDENRGRLYCMTKDGAAPSFADLAAVATMITVTYPKPPTFKVDVLACEFYGITVRAVVYLAEGALPSTVKAAVTANLAAYLAPSLASGAPNPSVGFGFEYKDADGNPTGEIPWSHFVTIIEQTTGIRKVGTGATDVVLNGLRSDVATPLHEFPKLATVELIDGDTGTAL